VARLLVIEDESELRALLVGTLEGDDHQVDEAADGTKGLALAQESRPDLVLCDILMEGLDGYGVLAGLRQDPGTALIPVIFLTGVGGEDALRKGMNLGADDYLMKPVTGERLVQAVRARLNRSALVRQEAERRLEELRTELARSLLPHELLTPLTAVIGLSSLLMEEGAVEAGDVREVARGIFRSGQRLEEMIAKLLVYAELQSSGLGAVATRLDMSEAAAVLAGGARSKAGRADREGDVTIQMEAFAGPVSSDHLRVLVEELVENALKFSKPHSRVIVQSRLEGEAWVLSVTDRGRGMTQEQSAGVRHHAPLLRRHQEEPALGLGLTIVNRLVGLYGGNVAFETTPGHGTTVTVHIPFALPERTRS
jgi:two-component system, sensor histidine kinase and response regulator